MIPNEQSKRSCLIWLVTTGEPAPTDGARVRPLRTGMVAEHLVQAGHRVVWWNSDFDHSAKRHRHGRHASKAISPNYSLQFLHGCGYSSHVSLKRLLDHRQVASAFLDRAVGMPPPDAIVAAFPTIELADACRRYAIPRAIPLALDVRDLWPDIFADVMPLLLRPIVCATLAPYDRMARRALRSANALLSITDPMLEWGLAKAGRTQNGLDASIPFAYPARTDSGPATNSSPDWLDSGPSRPFTICFFATFGKHFDIRTVIEAARLLERAHEPVQVLLCGTGDHGLDSLRNSARDLSSIRFPGWVDQGQIRAIMSASHMGLAPYVPRLDFIKSIPNKPVEYLSAGLPILTCLDGLLADTIRREDIGMVYRHGDASSLVEAIRTANRDRERLSAMSLRARSFFDRFYRSDIVMEQYHQFILRLAASQPRPIPPNST